MLVVALVACAIVLYAVNQEYQASFSLGFDIFGPYNIWVLVLGGIVFGSLLTFIASLSTFLQVKKLQYRLRKKDVELTKLRTGVLKN